MFMLIRYLAYFNNNWSTFSTSEWLVILHLARFVLWYIQYNLIHLLRHFRVFTREKFLFLTESYPDSYDQVYTQFNTYLETSLSGMASSIES